MEKLFIMPLLMLLTSCDDLAGSFIKETPMICALFIFVGLVIGMFLGYYASRIPNFDYTDEKPTLKQSLPVMLVWSIICAGLMFLVGGLYSATL